jgi:hypothetical protein
VKIGDAIGYVALVAILVECARIVAKAIAEEDRNNRRGGQ